VSPINRARVLLQQMCTLSKSRKQHLRLSKQECHKAPLSAGRCRRIHIYEGYSDSTEVPKLDHLRFPGHGATFGGARAAWRGPVGPNRPRPEGGVVGWPVRAVLGVAKITGPGPNLVQIGRPTRASSRSAQPEPARSRSPTLVPAHVRARACGVWRPFPRALTKAHRPMQAPRDLFTHTRTRHGARMARARATWAPGRFGPGLDGVRHFSAM
jgi:hypothetical protein